MSPVFHRYAIELMLLIAPTAVEAKNITYDCDTAANHYSELSLPVDGASFTVSGKLRFSASAASVSYVPSARVRIVSSTAPGKPPEVYAGFAMTALPADSKKTPSGASAVQMLSYIVNGKEDDVIPLSLMTTPGTIQPFSLSYDGNRVLVTLGSDSKSLPLRTKDPIVQLVCSTGEFLFTDLTISSTQ